MPLTPSAPAAPTTTFESILTGVKSRISAENPQALDSAISQLVGEEIAERATVLRRAAVLASATQKNLEACRPQSPGFDAAGDPLPSVFTQAQMGAKRKHEALLTRLDSALDSAVTRGEYKPLRDILSQNENKGQPGGKPEPDPSTA